MTKQQCVCSLCCYGFPCDQYTWETACAEAFAPGAVEAALESEGVQVAGVICIRLGCTTDAVKP